MIRQLKNYGFKDQTRTVTFSGLDLITSDDVNGVGKSAVLEAFKLALTGEVPGRAKNVEDILKFTSGDCMAVEIVAECRQGPVVVERKFLRDAAPGEKRPVRIDRVARKYEEGSEWIRQHIGAVSLSFDPFEFLNLSDARKRQWIIAHSPESLEFSRRGLYLLLLAGMVEKYLGSGIVHSLLLSFGVASLDEIIAVEGSAGLSSFEDRLIEVLQRQEPERLRLAQKALAGAFRFWSAGESSEKNSNALLAHLKSETLRLKNALREHTAALSCLGPVSYTGMTEPTEKISECREEIKRLEGQRADVANRLRQLQSRAEETIKREERIGFLKENISRIADKLNGEMGEALTELRDRWLKKRVATKEIVAQRDRFNKELTRLSEELQEQEQSLARLTSELRLKRDKQENLGASHFTCPVAQHIHCDTDMNPYREILSREITALAREHAETRASLATTAQKVETCQQQVDSLAAQLDAALQTNREVQREIDLIEDQIQADEKGIAKAQGLLKAYREEWALLESGPLETGFPAGAMDKLENENRALKVRTETVQNELDEHLRQEGKIEAIALLKRQQKQRNLELEIVKQAMQLLAGIQEEMATRIAGALEREVNDTLKLIDSRYDFILNLRGSRFEMGWNRDGRVIPFETMNSAHFILFIVPFLAALIQRLADVREKSGLPTLKAVCIEAESLTPGNLTALLQGLASMKARGSLDNVLVAHYHTVGESEKLWGFQEHILKETDAPVPV
jgi:hypothetical protein